MQPFSEVIAKNLHSSVDLKWTSKRLRSRIGTVEQRVAVFVVGPATVHVIFEHSETWAMYFGIASAEETQPIWWAFQIYDGVMQAVYEFLEREQPDVVTLVARGDGLKQAHSVTSTASTPHWPLSGTGWTSSPSVVRSTVRSAPIGSRVRHMRTASIAIPVGGSIRCA